MKSLDGNGQQMSHNQMPNALPAYFQRKALPTRALGGLMLLVAALPILLLVILVRLTSAGPGLYRQVRSGRNGVPFVLYKIRTMYNGAESVTGPCWCVPGDSRITPLGRVLRVLHLDELPQLINVARGEMDLIGPRPERPEFVAKLAREIPHYSSRLQIPPGVTGLAQINLPPDTTTDCVRKKLVLDCAYIREASFWLDVRILICTFLRMIGIRHGLAARWLGVKRYVGQIPSTGSRLRAESVPLHPHYEPALAASDDGERPCWVPVSAGVGSADGVGDVDAISALELMTHPLRHPR